MLLLYYLVNKSHLSFDPNDPPANINLNGTCEIVFSSCAIKNCEFKDFCGITQPKEQALIFLEGTEFYIGFLSR